VPDGPLVDTSVLIDYFAGLAGRQTAVLDDLFATGPVPCTAPVIVQEFLQGFATARDLAAARRVLRALARLDPPDYAMHERAAASFTALRRRGRTISSADILIVTMAAHWGCGLLTSDRQQANAAASLGVPLF
jgi:predicted nucleic acid-binding protein